MPGRLLVQENDGRVQVSWQGQGQIAPEGGGFEPFESPLSASDLEDLRWYLEDYLRAPYAVYEDRGKAIASRLPDWGEALFESVFGSDREGGKVYQQTTGRNDWELWIASDSAPFLSLPWELLRDPDRETPLALGISGIHRTIAAPADSVDVPSGASLRVLMVIARPHGDRDVPYRSVARPLLRRLAAVQGRVELEVLRPPTFDALKARLRQAKTDGEPFQILHFDGHGAFEEAAGRGRFARRSRGLLVFETEKGEAEYVTADELTTELTEASVPLVVLNACQSGMMGQKPDALPEAAVATRLIHEGDAAVVAMGYSVYAVAAAEMVATFYERLFAGDPVSRAVTAGRRQLCRQNLRPSPKGKLPLEDWMVPVHYGRREVAFPRLRRESPRGTLSLRDALESVRQKELATSRPGGEGVHQEGEIDAADGRFFGRDREFQWLETKLRTDHAVLLRGIGGAGKTELAKAFGRWLRDSGGLDHPDLVFFHSFEPGLASFGLDGVVSSIGLRLFGADFARLDSETRVQAVLEALRQHRMLLIWDNFETVFSMPDPQRVTPVLDEAERKRVREFLAEVHEEARGGVILTSRSPEDWLGTTVRRREVRGLASEDVVEYADTLLADHPRAAERRKAPAFGDLLEYLGGHPLSLRLILPRLEEAEAGALLEELKTTPAPDLKEIDEGERLDSAIASVHYSFRQLPEEDQKRLPVLALLEGVVDVDLLGPLSAQEEAPERFRQVATDDWKQTLDRGAAFGLLTELGLGIYRLHPALPRYLRAIWERDAGEAFEQEQAAATLAKIRAHAGLGSWLLQQIQGGCADIAFTVLQVEQRNLGAAAAAGLERQLWSEAQDILQPLDELWDARGMIAEATGWVDRVREAVEGRGGSPPDFDTEAGALWLFMVGSDANRKLLAGQLAEAEEVHQSIRRVLEASVSAGARRPLAVAYHQLGMVAEDRGDLSSAESWYRRSLEILESLDDRPGMAASYHQLGMVTQVQGDLSSAESWYRRSLEIEESLDDRPGMAVSYHQLGLVTQDRGDLLSAESWYWRSLEIGESLADRPGMAASYHQLGMVAEDRGDLLSAEFWYQRSLEIRESLTDRPGIAQSYHQLGRVAQLQGDLSSAESWTRRSLEILESLADRPRMAQSYHQLGRVAQLQGDFSSGESWYRRSLEILEALIDRAGMVLTYAQLGRLFEAKEDVDQALEWTVRCVALFEDFPHPSTGSGPDNLVRLTGILGWPALETAWRNVTGQPVPDPVRHWIEQQLQESPP